MKILKKEDIGWTEAATKISTKKKKTTTINNNKKAFSEHVRKQRNVNMRIYRATHEQISSRRRNGDSSRKKRSNKRIERDTHTHNDHCNHE